MIYILIIFWIEPIGKYYTIFFWIIRNNSRFAIINGLCTNNIIIPIIEFDSILIGFILSSYNHILGYNSAIIIPATKSIAFNSCCFRGNKSVTVIKIFNLNLLVLPINKYHRASFFLEISKEICIFLNISNAFIPAYEIISLFFRIFG